MKAVEKIKELDNSIKLGKAENFFLGVIGVMGLAVGIAMNFLVLAGLSVGLCGIIGFNCVKMLTVHSSVVEDSTVEFAKSH